MQGVVLHFGQADSHCFQYGYMLTVLRVELGSLQLSRAFEVQNNCCFVGSLKNCYFKQLINLSKPLETIAFYFEQMKNYNKTFIATSNLESKNQSKSSLIIFI